MKKIDFWKKITNSLIPFWMPWGFGSWLWKVIAFLILLSALLILLSLFRNCDCRDDPAGLPEELVDNRGFTPAPVPDTNPGFPGQIKDPGPDLPSHDDNLIQPVDEGEVIDNPDARTRIVGNRLNVILNSDAGDEAFKTFAREFKSLYPSNEYSVAYYDTKTKLMQLKVPTDKREEVKSTLPTKITDVDFKLFDDTIFAGTAALPKDKIFNYPKYSWFYFPIKAPEAWSETMGSEEVTIAVVDSYFDLNHPDLNGSRIVKPYSVRFGTSDVAPAADCPRIDPDPSHGVVVYAPFEHGSMVASQALGTANNGAAMCGIAPRCKFMPVSMGHQFTSLTILQGLLYAIYQGADVVNISAGVVFDENLWKTPVEEQIRAAKTMGTSEAEIWDYVFKLADERNVTVVWAAGNERVFIALDPSKRGKNTVRVAAVDENLKPANFTNFGNFPDRNIDETTVSAPGVNIMGAMPYSTYDVGPGTSFAAPLVAGAIGLMKSVNKNLSNEQIIHILKTTGKPMGTGSKIGPLIQINAAVKAAKTTYL